MINILYFNFVCMTPIIIIYNFKDLIILILIFVIIFLLLIFFGYTLGVKGARKTLKGSLSIKNF